MPRLVAVTAVFVAVTAVTAVFPVMAVVPVVMAGLCLRTVPVTMLSMTLVAVLGVGSMVVTVFAVAVLGVGSMVVTVFAVSMTGVLTVTAGAAVPVSMAVSPVPVMPVIVFRIEDRLG